MNKNAHNSLLSTNTCNICLFFPSSFPGEPWPLCQGRQKKQKFNEKKKIKKEKQKKKKWYHPQ